MAFAIMARETLHSFVKHGMKLSSFLVFVSLCSVAAGCSSAGNTGGVSGTSRTLSEGARKSAMDRVIAGSAYEMQEMYSDAILEYQQALRIDPTADIYFFLAKCYAATERIDRSIEHLDSALVLDSLHIPSLQLRAELALGTSLDIATARECYRKIVSVEPRYDYQYMYGRLLEYTSSRQAEEFYKKIYDPIEDEGAAVPERLSALAMERRDTAEAIRWSAVVVRSRPGEPSGYYAHLQLLLAGSTDEALAFWVSTHSVLEADDQAEMFAVLVNALAEGGGADSMLAAAAPALLNARPLLCDSSMQCLLASSVLYAARRDTANALAAVERSVALAPDNTDIARYALGQYLYFGKPQKAVEQVMVMKNAGLMTPELFLIGSAAALAANNDATALSFAIQGVEADPESEDLWCQLGMVYSRMDSAGQSDGAYERALELNPRNALANNNLAYSRSERGEMLEESLRMSDVAVAAEPDNASYLDTKGWILYKLGRYDEAESYLRQALAVDSSSATLWEHLGDVLHKRGETAEARQAWRQSVYFEPLRQSALERLRKNP